MNFPNLTKKQAEKIYTEEMLKQAHQVTLGQANATRTANIVGASAVGEIEWPAFKEYGHDHHAKTSQLAVHIAQTYPELKPFDIDVVKAAAMFHDIGREAGWREKDPSHSRRSADLAETAMRKDSLNWSRHDVRNEACILIARHELAGPPPYDPRMIALWDADCLESARLAPMTEEGLQIMMTRYAMTISPWSKIGDHKDRYRRSRGWTG